LICCSFLFFIDIKNNRSIINRNNFCLCYYIFDNVPVAESDRPVYTIMHIEYLRKLKQDHFKITPKRRAILDLFDKKDKCLTPEIIWDHLKKTFKQSGLPSVYRNLDLFVKQGILIRIDRDERKRYYALCHDHSGHHHHHIVCVECGKVDDFPVCHFPDIKDVKGYKVLSHSMQINGICKACQ